MKKVALLLIFILSLFVVKEELAAQQTFPVNGVADQRQGIYAFTNATIYKTYNQKIDSATLLIEKGKVTACAAGVRIPKGAVIVDCKGKTIYPSFIDVYTDYGMPEVGKKPNSRRGKPQALSDKDGAYSWNQALKPEIAAAEHFSANKKSATEWIKLGFGALVTHQKDGIARGVSALVSTATEREHELIIKDKAAQHFSFSKGTSTQNYPSSLMGTMALLRQTYHDADWYAQVGKNEETNLSLDAWKKQQALPQIFEVRDWQEALRADKIGDEFGIQYIIVGGGDEYRRVQELKGTGAKFILPLDFPAAYDVEDPFDARQADLADMKHWELAPTNPKAMEDAGIEFAFSLHGLKNKKEFFANLRKAIQYGLSKPAALKALTYTPAQMIEATNLVGSLEKGRWANFFIANGDIFEENTSIVQHRIKGEAYLSNDLNTPDLSGKYNLLVDGDMLFPLLVKGESGTQKMTISYSDTTQVKVNYTLDNNLITLSFIPQNQDGVIRLSGTIAEKKWSGKGQMPNGTWVDWAAQYSSDTEAQKKEEKTKLVTVDVGGTVTYPFVAFGYTEKPQQNKVLFKNATVWTNEAEGILKNTDVLIEKGKIVKIGENLKAAGAIEIDATNKHLTCGIIDEHSHIAMSRGVNESGQVSSAEVNVEDIINAEDINIYRQLAGGVTTSQLLHGSANPIGGQSGLIKLRWGSTGDEMLFEGADKFIKFALGENVKQSNWGDDWRVRFPQTRMGVEQVFEDYFSRAAEYKKLKASGQPYRKDLDLETIVEILDSRRFITCHSYRQSEINMLMKVAERHGFRVNTFTHILEGYKIAEKMAAHGAAGSTFSDWWAYKYEVIDAIPQNGEIMHKNGVLTGFNSDDAEMARRLNQEAAKAIKYGNLSEEEAWKFVTLNPAKMLHIDNQVGSVKAGKDADLVLWSDNPLSIYAKAEMTFVDGRKYFDREVDKIMQDAVRKERARLVQKMLAEKNGGGKTQAVKGKHRHLYHCDHFEDEAR